MKSTSHMNYFVECRNESLNHVANQTNNLIIRLDKLINRHANDEELSRRDYERKVVPWSDDTEYSRCRVCNARFSLTRRRHHCRLCGKIMCNACSLSLTFSSARKLTGPEFTRPTADGSLLDDESHSSDATSKGGVGNTGGGSVSMALMKSDSLQFVKTKLGSMLPFGGSGGAGGSCDVSYDAPEDSSEEQSLRICDVCKRLLDRREEAMDLRTSHSVFVDVYQKLCSLLTQISNLAPSFKNMAESLNNGESIYTVESANELRKKLVSVQREIMSLAERIEQWGTNPDDPLVTRPPEMRELLLQKNIKQMAIGTLHTVLAAMPDLPTEERYAKLRAAYQERLAHRREQERLEAERAQSMRSFASNPSILSSTLGRAAGVGGSGDKQASTSSLGSSALDRMQRARTTLKPSASLNMLDAKGGADEGWVSNSPFQLNPFKEDEAEELSAIQQQYLNIKSYLQQAAQAGRLEEVEILEKNLMEMEQELKRLQLSTPRLVD